MSGTKRLLEAACKAQDRQHLAQARLLLHGYLILHPRDARGLACAATVWSASGWPATALRLARRALKRLHDSDCASLRFFLEGDVLETGVRAAGTLRDQVSSEQKRGVLEKTILGWLLRRVEREPESAASLRLEPSLDDMQGRLDNLLRQRATKPILRSLEAQ